MSILYYIKVFSMYTAWLFPIVFIPTGIWALAKGFRLSDKSKRGIAFPVGAVLIIGGLLRIASLIGWIP